MSKCNWKHPVFKEIWEENNGCSQLTGQHLGVPSPINFAHIKPKGKFEELMYEKDNILLVTEYEHFLLDAGNSDLRENYTKEMQSKGCRVKWELFYKNGNSD